MGELVVLPEAVHVIEEVGVDVLGLVDYVDFLFSQDEEEEISFETFFFLLLQLRGSNTATVKDIMDLRKFLIQSMSSGPSSLPGKAGDATTMAQTVLSPMS